MMDIELASEEQAAVNLMVHKACADPHRPQSYAAGSYTHALAIAKLIGEGLKAAGHQRDIVVGPEGFITIAAIIPEKTDGPQE